MEQLWKNEKDAHAIAAQLFKSRTPTGLSMDVLNTIALEELSALGSTGPVFRQDLLAALARWDGITPAAFDAELQFARKARVENESKNQRRWTMLLPVEFDLVSRESNDALDFKLFGLDISIAPYAAMRDEFASLPATSEDLIYYSGELRPIPTHFFRMSMLAPHAQRAWSVLNDQFASFWGALEFEVSRTTFSYLTNEGKAAAHLPHPRWYLMTTDGASFEGARYFVVNRRDDLEVDAGALSKAVESLASRYSIGSPPEKTTPRLIMDSLRLYGEALLQPFIAQRFLGLWQMAERIVPSTENSDTREIVQRLLALQRTSSSTRISLKYSLVHVAHLRNVYVHSGRQSGIHDIHVSLLKLACVTALRWLIAHSADLPSEEHLGEFFRIRTKNGSAIEAAVDAAKFLLDLRRKEEA